MKKLQSKEFLIVLLQQLKSKCPVDLKQSIVKWKNVFKKYKTKKGVCDHVACSII